MGASNCTCFSRPHGRPGEGGGEGRSERTRKCVSEDNGIRRAVLGDPDDAPPVPEPADVYVKPGDPWLLGDHRLLCGDATHPEDGCGASRSRSGS